MIYFSAVLYDSYSFKPAHIYITYCIRSLLFFLPSSILRYLHPCFLLRSGLELVSSSLHFIANFDGAGGIHKCRELVEVQVPVRIICCGIHLFHVLQVLFYTGQLPFNARNRRQFRRCQVHIRALPEPVREVPNAEWGLRR